MKPTPTTDPEQYLDVVRAQHDPPTEAVAQIDDGHAAAEADDVGEGHPERDNEDLVEENQSGLILIFCRGCPQQLLKHPVRPRCPQQSRTGTLGTHAAAVGRAQARPGKHGHSQPLKLSPLVPGHLPHVTHVVLLEESKIANDPDPNQQRGGAQEDAANVVAGKVLQGQRCHGPEAWPTPSPKSPTPPQKP